VRPRSSFVPQNSICLVGMASFLLCCVLASLGAVSSTESPFLGRRAQAQGASAAGASDAGVDVGAAPSNSASTGHTDTSGVNNKHKSDCSGRRLQGESSAGADAGAGGAAAGTSIRTSDECVENNKAAGSALGMVVGIVIAANALVGLGLCAVIYVRRGKMMQDEPVYNAEPEKKVQEPTTMGVAESNLAGA